MQRLRATARTTGDATVRLVKARKAELYRSVLDGGDFAAARSTAADIRTLLE